MKKGYITLLTTNDANTQVTGYNDDLSVIDAAESMAGFWIIDFHTMSEAINFYENGECLPSEIKKIIEAGGVAVEAMVGGSSANYYKRDDLPDKFELDCAFERLSKDGSNFVKMNHEQFLKALKAEMEGGERLFTDVSLLNLENELKSFPNSWKIEGLSVDEIKRITSEMSFIRERMAAQTITSLCNNDVEMKEAIVGMYEIISEFLDEVGIDVYSDIEEGFYYY